MNSYPARIHIVSDAHSEDGIVDIPPVEADVTVLAGDIWTKNRCMPWRDAAAHFGHPTIFIAGNHEYWYDAVEKVPVKLRAAAAARNATFLECEETVIAGVRFLGCTLWTDFRLLAGDDLSKVRESANRVVAADRNSAGMRDFDRIRVASDAYRKFRPKDAARLFGKSVAWLRDRLAEPSTLPTVVVTHHAPSPRCLPERLREDAYAVCYASDLEDFITYTQPELWVHGHIHPEVVEPFRIGRTLVVSNPRGYPSEPNHAFDPGFTVDVARLEQAYVSRLAS